MRCIYGVSGSKIAIAMLALGLAGHSMAFAGQFNDATRDRDARRIDDVRAGAASIYRDDAADGVWECTDPGGAALGTIIIEGAGYSFITPDGTDRGTGTLRQVDYMSVPGFSVLSGYLNDQMGVLAVVLRETAINGEHPVILALPGGKEGTCFRPRGTA